MIRRVWAATVAALLLASVVGLSAVPWPWHPRGDGVLRLSWRMRGEVVEACRTRSPEELEELPVHMRNPEACEGRATAYRLEVTVDGRERWRERVQPAGARGDRPIYVFHDERVAPGRHRVRVLFEAVDTAATSQPLEFTTTVDVRPRQVVLITYDPEARRLEVANP